MAGGYAYHSDKRTNEELVELIQAGDKGLMESLWHKNRGLIAEHARKYINGGRADYDIKDLMQAGYLSLCEAVLTYQPERGAVFATFLSYSLRRHMRSVIGIRTSKRDAALHAFSLDISLDSDNDTTLADFLPAEDDTEGEVVEKGYKEYLRAVVRRAVVDMKKPAEREVIEEIYFNRQTKERFAEVRGITIAWVNALLHSAYKSLRRNPQIQELAAEYFACEIYYIPTGATSYQSSGVSSVEIGAYRMERERQRRQERALVDMINSLIPDGAIDFE